LAAILAADIAGYSALMGADEGATVRDLKGHQAVILPMIGEHGGRVIDTAGDGILAEFGSVVNAVACAIAIQKTMAERNFQVEDPRRMQFRIGVNQGDVIHDETRVYGDGVNVAARLESIRSTPTASKGPSGPVPLATQRRNMTSPLVACSRSLERLG
jgi:adenylate cyclase